MTPAQSCLLGGVFAILTALGLFIFPGHTFLLSDTQIYLPLFEHLRNPALFTNELILNGAHLSFTIYDEVTLALSRLTGRSLEHALLAQQFFFRWLGMWGAFWLATSIGLSRGAAVLSSSALWLGAFVYGPAVITTEFEPVPRGFAVPLLVASLGALAQHWPNRAAFFIALAFLYHAPAVWPILVVAILARHWRPLAWTAGAATVLTIFASLQQGALATQPFFSLIDPAHRAIMMLRAPYNWISLWPPRHILQFLITAPLAWFALRRIEDLLAPATRPYFRWIPIIGLLTIPASYLLLEQYGWALLPQLQPMRALLYCHLFCQWLGLLVAWRELKDGAPLRAFLWLIVPFSLALQGDLLLIGPAHAILLALIAAAIFLATRYPRREYAWAASFTLVLLFGIGFEARAYKPVETPTLTQLSTWATANTPTPAVFFFPDLGRRPEPGIFRARSLRAVYVCWKQGGQVNYFPTYASTWFERWTHLLAPNHPPLDYNDLRRRGITHLVFTKDTPAEPLPQLFSNGAYRVYQLAK